MSMSVPALMHRSDKQPPIEAFSGSTVGSKSLPEGRYEAVVTLMKERLAIRLVSDSATGSRPTGMHS